MMVPTKQKFRDLLCESAPTCERRKVNGWTISAWGATFTAWGQNAVMLLLVAGVFALAGAMAWYMITSIGELSRQIASAAKAEDARDEEFRREIQKQYASLLDGVRALVYTSLLPEAERRAMRQTMTKPRMLLDLQRRGGAEE